MGELDSSFDYMNGLIDRFVTINSAQAERADLAGRVTGERSVYVILAAMLVAICAGIAVFAALVRSVISPLLAMTREIGELSGADAARPMLRPSCARMKSADWRMRYRTSRQPPRPCARQKKKRKRARGQNRSFSPI